MKLKLLSLTMLISGVFFAQNLASIPKLKTDNNTKTVSQKTDRIRKLSLFPNPVQNSLELSLVASDEIELMYIEFYSEEGKLVKTEYKSGNDIIDVSMLTPGTYLIRAISESTSHYIKFVKE